MSKKKQKKKKAKSINPTCQQPSVPKIPSQKTAPTFAERMRNRASAFYKKWKKWIKTLTALGFFAIITLIADLTGIFSTKETSTSIQNNNQYINQNTFQFHINFPSVTEQPADLSQVNAPYHQGKSFFTQGDYDSAIHSYKEALTANSGADVNTARIQYAMGLAYKYNSNADEALHMYTQALGTLQSLLESSAPTEHASIEQEMNYVHYLRSSAYLEKKDFQRALDECELCENAETDPLPEEDSEYTFGPASVYSLRGQIYAGSFYYSHSALVAMEEKDLGYTLEDALYYMEWAIKEKSQNILFDSEDLVPDNMYVPAYYNWAFLMTLNPQYYSKGAVYVLSQKDAEMAEILTNRAQLLLMMGYHDASVKDCEAALEIYEDLPFHEQYNIYRTYLTLAYAKLFNGFNDDGSIQDTAIEDCGQYIRKGLEHNKAWYGENHFLTATAYENAGWANLLSGNYTKAIEDLQMAKRIFKKLGMKEDAAKQSRFIQSVKEVKAAGEGQWMVETIPFNGYIEYGMYYLADQ